MTTTNGLRDMTAEEYFSDYSAVSQSALKIFAKRRRLYEGYYVLRSQAQPPDTDPMRKGTALHTALLMPEVFDKLVVTFPSDLLAKDGAVSTTEAKAFRDEHEAAGRVVLKESDLANVRAMAESVYRTCGNWFDLPSVRERSLYWTDELTGLPLKMRMDWLLVESEVLIDLKSTADASPAAFRKRIEQNGYWRQHAHYVDGIEQNYHFTPAFYFLAVEDSWPFACSLHELDEMSARDARLTRHDELSQLAQCIETGDFSETWERSINSVSLSRFCFQPT